LHQSPPRAPSQIQGIQGDAGLEQVQVRDWEEEAFEDEAAEEELLRVQQEIEKLYQELESIMRRQAIVQRAEARRQHINQERTRLVELHYTVEILHNQEQRQEPPFEHSHHQNNPPPLPYIQMLPP
jgi:hypothetical protein